MPPLPYGSELVHQLVHLRGLGLNTIDHSGITVEPSSCIEYHANFVGLVNIEYRMMREVAGKVGSLNSLFLAQLSCTSAVINHSSVLGF